MSVTATDKDDLLINMESGDDEPLLLKDPQANSAGDVNETAVEQKSDQFQGGPDDS